MADNEQKALQLVAEAEKKLNPNKGFFGGLFGCVFYFHVTNNRKSIETRNKFLQHRIYAF